MPPAAGADQARLIGDGAGEAAAAMAEQLAVGEIARRWSCSCRAGTSRRSRCEPDVNRARDELLAGAALAGDQHRQVVALQPLDLLDDALSSRRWRRGIPAAAARAMRSTARRPTADGPIARRAQREALARDGGRSSAAAASPDGRSAAATRPGRSAGLRRRGRAARRSAAPRAVGVPVRPPRAPCVARRVGIAAGRARSRARRRRPAATKTHRAVAVDGFEQRRGGLARRADRAAPPHPRSAARSHRRHRPARRRTRRCRRDVSSACAACVSSRSRSAPSCSKIAERLVQVPLGDRARAGLAPPAGRARGG